MIYSLLCVNKFGSCLHHGVVAVKVKQQSSDDQGLLERLQILSAENGWLSVSTYEHYLRIGLSTTLYSTHSTRQKSVRTV